MLKSKQVFLIFFALFTVYLFLLNNVLNTYNRHQKIINEDAFGYYTILPAFFKYNDPNFAFLDSSVRNLPLYKDYIPPVVNSLDNNTKVCKYYAGVAILQLPFYLAGNQIAKFQKQTIGYESVFQYAILCSVIFYLALAIWFFIKAFQLLGVSSWLTIVLGALALFGTNIYCYTTYDPAYSHVYSIFAFNAFIYYSIKFKKHFKQLDLLKIGLLAGIIIAIRPLNGLLLLVFPMVMGLQNFLSILAKTKNYLLLSGVLIAPFIQSYLWFWQTGKWYVYPYVNEYLEFGNPKVIELLFGFDCGWFIYTPFPLILLISSLTIILTKKKIGLFVTILLLASSIIYLTSCWYYVHYGCTLSCRPLTEYIFPIFILFAYTTTLIYHANKTRITIIAMAIIGILYNQIIHYQFYNQIINWCKMDKAKFKMVFLKTHPYYAYSTSDFWNFESFKTNQIIDSSINLNFSINPNQSKDSKTIEFDEIIANDSNILIDLELKIKMNNNINESVISMLLTENNQYIDLHHFLLKRVVKEKNNWTDYKYQILINKPIRHCKIDFTLESIDNNSITELSIQNVKLHRIAY
ncbi:MAG: hypothetical protein Q8K70_11525 [Bacteroidota bacterium]|nr:hypothetical protein [Bacteroidota bacterium]